MGGRLEEKKGDAVIVIEIPCLYTCIHMGILETWGGTIDKRASAQPDKVWGKTCPVRSGVGGQLTEVAVGRGPSDVEGTETSLLA